MRPRPDHVSPVFGSQVLRLHFRSVHCSGNIAVPPPRLFSRRLSHAAFFCLCDCFFDLTLQVCNVVRQDRDKLPPFIARVVEHIHVRSLRGQLVERNLPVLPVSHLISLACTGLASAVRSVSRISGRQALLIVGQDLDAKDLACRSAALRSSIRELRRSASAARMIRYFPHREQPMTSPS
jgi:hypothetical protein